MSGIKENTQYLYNETAFVTPEMKAKNAKYADPLSLNFKLMIDYNKPYGLFADEDKYMDSALAYLKRIGELTRYQMLVIWIAKFKNFVKNYEFLILNIDGLDIITNAKPHEIFRDDDKVTMTIRETSDMLIQSLLTTYRHIWYDDERGVEVLPANLRRFDVNILVYSAGYYNMVLYDTFYSNKNDTDANITERKMYPTIRKLSEDYFLANSTTYEFNHHLIKLEDAQINNDESGKSFFGSISNEMQSDFVKNTLALNFRFASYKGVFNNIFGEFDFVKLLALSAATAKVASSSTTTSSNTTSSNTTEAETMAEKLKSFFKDVKSSGFDNMKTSLTQDLTRRVSNYKREILESQIGNAISNVLSPDYITGMMTSKLKTVANMAEIAARNKITSLANSIYDNFSDEFVDIFNVGDKNKNLEYQAKISSFEDETISNASKLDTNMKLESESNTDGLSRRKSKSTGDTIYNRRNL